MGFHQIKLKNGLIVGLDYPFLRDRIKGQWSSYERYITNFKLELIKD